MRKTGPGYLDCPGDRRQADQGRPARRDRGRRSAGRRARSGRGQLELEKRPIEEWREVEIPRRNRPGYDPHKPGSVRPKERTHPQRLCQFERPQGRAGPCDQISGERRQEPVACPPGGRRLDGQSPGGSAESGMPSIRRACERGGRLLAHPGHDLGSPAPAVLLARRSPALDNPVARIRQNHSAPELSSASSCLTTTPRALEFFHSPGMTGARLRRRPDAALRTVCTRVPRKPGHQERRPDIRPLNRNDCAVSRHAPSHPQGNRSG